MISGKVYDEIKNRPSIPTVSMGAVRLKNVEHPVPVFAVSNEGLQIPVGQLGARTELRLFGGAVLTGDQGPVKGRSAQRRRLALLALLAVARRPVSRDKVIAYLWPERDTDSARRLLSESLYVLRKALGEDAILTVGDDLQLNAGVVWTDCTAFEDALGRGDREQAAGLYSGDFLDGFFISDAAEFSQWADVERERYARAHKEALEVLAKEALDSGDGRAAVGWWRGRAAADPYNARIALGRRSRSRRPGIAPVPSSTRAPMRRCW